MTEEITARHRHHRLRDHFGTEDDLHVTLSEAIGPWEVDTPIRFVLEDLIGRLTSLETSDKVIHTFSLNAYIPGTFFLLDAVIAGAPSSSFTLHSVIALGSSFTLNAYIHGGGTFKLSAVII